MKKRIKTNCNYTLKPETHSFLGEKGKDIIFSGSGYAECEGTNGIIVNRNQYYNIDEESFNNNCFGVGSAMNKRLRCNTFSFQIRNKNLYGASLLNFTALPSHVTIPEVDYKTGAFRAVYTPSANHYLYFTFIRTENPKIFNIGGKPLYLSCFAKNLKHDGDYYLATCFDTNNENYDITPFFEFNEKGGYILNVNIGADYGFDTFDNFGITEMIMDCDNALYNSQTKQDVWFYPVISTEPITEEFFDNYVGFVPFPKYPDDVDVISVNGLPNDTRKVCYALSYDLATEPIIDDYTCDYAQDYIKKIFTTFIFPSNKKIKPWNGIKLSNENYYYQWVWNTLNTGIMGNDWTADEAVVESLIDSPQVYKPLFMLGYHHGGLSLITTGEKMPTFPQDADQEIRPVIQTLVFVNYEAQVPDYISPVYTIVYPTLVDAD